MRKQTSAPASKTPLASRRAGIDPQWRKSELLAIDAWINAQHKTLTRAAAIRQLVQIALDSTRPKSDAKKPAPKRASKLAEKELDRLGDDSVSATERAFRKKRLLQGPSEFRALRVDQRRRGR